MTDLGEAALVREWSGQVTQQALSEIRAAGQPVVMRGLVDDWPVVQAATRSDQAVVEHILRGGSTRPVSAIAAAPCEGGRFFYNENLSGLNFMKGKGQLETFLADLLRADEVVDPPGMAIQSESIPELLPHLAAETRLPFLRGVEPRIWIGNRIRVAPHFDIKENIACCVAGQRRFTIFPPDQTANLYPGPFDLTPAGTPVSMVDLASPDLDTHPKFAQAWAQAQVATLQPGDAVYIPYCWWHGVESLAAVSILVNYWWSDGLPEGIGSPYDALLHAILSFRHMPPEKREVWRGLLDFYVFEQKGDPVSHLPEHARGIMADAGPDLFHRMRSIIRSALS